MGAFRAMDAVMEESLLLQTTKEHLATDSKSFKMPELQRSRNYWPHFKMKAFQRGCAIIF